MPAISRRDRLIFAVTNALLYVRHPLFAALFRHRLGRWTNFATPGALGDLVQWRKLFDRNPAFPVLSDKLAVKSWVAARCPELLIPQTLWVGDRSEDVDPLLLGPDVVVKTNNATSQNHFPGRDGTDYTVMVRRFRRWMARGRGLGGGGC